MAFSVPAFNLLCDLWTGPWLTKVLRLSGVQCNLQMSPRREVGPAYYEDADAARLNGPLYLLLPSRTDVRSPTFTGVADVVECPSGTGRWYAVTFVDDVGRGFSNEFRLAQMVQITQFVNGVQYAGLLWPVPMP